MPPVGLRRPPRVEELVRAAHTCPQQIAAPQYWTETKGGLSVSPEKAPHTAAPCRGWDSEGCAGAPFHFPEAVWPDRQETELDYGFYCTFPFSLLVSSCFCIAKCSGQELYR